MNTYLIILVKNFTLVNISLSIVFETCNIYKNISLLSFKKLNYIKLAGNRYLNFSSYKFRLLGITQSFRNFFTNSNLDSFLTSGLVFLFNCVCSKSILGSIFSITRLPWSNSSWLFCYIKLNLKIELEYDN